MKDVIDCIVICCNFCFIDCIIFKSWLIALIFKLLFIIDHYHEMLLDLSYKIFRINFISFGLKFGDDFWFWSKSILKSKHKTDNSYDWHRSLWEFTQKEIENNSSSITNCRNHSCNWKIDLYFSTNSSISSWDDFSWSFACDLSVTQSHEFWSIINESCGFKFRWKIVSNEVFNSFDDDSTYGKCCNNDSDVF